MNAILSLAEEKEILSWHIAPATGRSRQLLDALLSVILIRQRKKC